MGYLDQKITCSLKYLFVGALCILFSFINTENLYLNLAIACTVEIVLFIYFHRIIAKSVLSFATIFVVILALFHFGQVFICGYWNDLIKELKLRIVLKYLSDTDCIHSMRIINISFVAIFYGILKNIERECYNVNNQIKSTTNELDKTDMIKAFGIL